MTDRQCGHSRVVGSAGALTGYHWGLTRKRAMLGWEAETSFDQLVRTMVDADLDFLQGKLKGIS